MALMNAAETPIQAQAAAKALLAFWRAAGVDMDVAEAVYATSAKTAGPVRAAPSPAPKAPVARPRAKATSLVDNAVALAKSAQTVAELRAAVMGFEGCTLKATARNTVFSDGVDDAPVLIIGEAPDRDEDEHGKPFAGAAGQMLDKMLAAIGLNRQTNVLLSNTIFWRPPGNRAPTPGEVMTCLPFVERLIELKQPKLLVLMGKAASNTLLKREEAVTRLRGRRMSYSNEGLALPVNAIVMLHPAYLMRQPQQKRLAWADLLATQAWLEELGVGRVP
jgi:DNA polymerase